MSIAGLNTKQLHAAPKSVRHGTLYSFYRRNLKNTESKLSGWWQENRQNTNRTDGYLNPLGAYKKIETSKEPQFNDLTIANKLFESEKNKSYTKKIFQYQFDNLDIDSADSFFNVLQRARSFVFQALVYLPDVLVTKSFPATYFHKDILMMFDQKANPDNWGMFDEKFAKQRIAGTAEIILRTVYGAKEHGWSNKWPPRTLANCLMLAEMHNHVAIGGNKDPKDKHRLYNQSSVAFTLLTFSYLVGMSFPDLIKKQRKRGNPVHEWEGTTSEMDWYFFWKALGSAMGLHSRLLPNTHKEAEELWGEFITSDKILGSEHLEHLVSSGKFETGYTNEKYFGRTLAEVIKALETIGVEDRSRSFKTNLEVANDTNSGRDPSQRTRATLIILDSLRHGTRDPKLKLDQELIYLVDVRHLLQVYKKLDGYEPEFKLWGRALLWQKWFNLWVRK